MSSNASNPASAAAPTGSGDAFPGWNCSSDIPPKAHVAQTKISLLHDDIFHNVSALQATLDVVIAAHFSGDSTCLLYGLRRARAYWRCISASSAELVAADADRLSALRQGEAGR
jgi:hypothetical protein